MIYLFIEFNDKCCFMELLFVTIYIFVSFLKRFSTQGKIEYE